jgi:hypothetical protein
MAEGITIQLGNGATISECVQKVQKYCENIPAYEIYDMVVVPQDNAVFVLDICLANNVGAGMDMFAIRRFWRHASKYKGEIEEALSRIPRDIELHEVEDAFFRDLRALFALFFDENKISGILYAGVTKTLHKKRPRVIPLVDWEIVIDGYLKTRSGLGTSNDADYLVEVTKRIREDVRENLNQLQEIQRGLQPDHGGDLTLLRIFDILLYQRFQEQSQ